MTQLATGFASLPREYQAVIRLAIQVAAGLLNGFPDGIFFVSLAEISQPDRDGL